MRRSLLLIAAGLLAVPQLAAAATCPDRVPGPITAATAAGTKCQAAIAKAGAKYLGTKLKALSKCRVKEPLMACPVTDPNCETEKPVFSCPSAKDTEKLQKAALGAAASIAKACGDDAAQAGLSSSYNAETDDAVISSCMLSQHSVAADLVLAESHGATTEGFPGTSADRAKCIAELSKSATKFFTGALKLSGKCLAAQTKVGTPGDLSPICLGSFAGGVRVEPTDTKTAMGLTKLITKTEAAVAKKCTLSADDIESLFAYPGSTSVADLQNGLVCGGMGAMFDVAVQQYGETGEFVANGPDALQTAVSAATSGDKLLVGSGDYEEEVVVGTSGLSIVGCGAATDQRPRIIPPTPEGTGRGIQSAGHDDLLFQSLDFFDQNSDHIFVASSTNLTFRDITGDGNRNTRYAVFPVNSNNVLVELCDVEAQDDAPIYVGQSSGVVVRHSRVRNGVAGIEIENTGSAQVYGNVGVGNTAGILVFKDPGLPVQLSECHDIHHNVFDYNNEPNFGTGTVAGVPRGTGMLVISADSTPYAYNFSRGNLSAGFILTDQQTAGFDDGNGNYSADSSIDDNYVYRNSFRGNGADPDPGVPVGVDALFVSDGFSNWSGNCENGNDLGTEFFFLLGMASPPNIGTCVLPPPAFPGCPTPPIP